MCAITEKWYNDGKAEGIAEGVARGIEQGKAEGKVEGKAEGKAEGIAEGEARGIEKGKAEGYNSVAEAMIKDKMPLEQIQKFTKLSLEKLNAISKEIGVALVM